MKKYLLVLFVLYAIGLYAQYAPNQLVAPLLDYRVRLVDMDGDGFEDIVGRKNDDSKFAWIPNEGGLGEFLNRKHIEVENIGIYDLIDFDGDGDMDMVYIDVNEDMYYLTNTNGTFDFPSPQPIDIDLDIPCSISFDVVDVDIDGLADIVFSENCNGMFWYKNLGNGYSDKIIIDEELPIQGLLSADYDLDGDIDIVCLNNNGELRYLENADGNGTFTDNGIFQADLGLFRAFEISDLNGDGYLDLLYAFTSSNKVSWQQNMGDGSFGDPQILIDSNEPRDATSGDLDGDGDLDIVACLYLSNLTVWFENMDGQGNFSDAIVISSGNQANEYFTLDLSDLENDGDEDILASSWNNDLVGWIENSNGAGAFGPFIPLSNDAVGGNIGVADLDNSIGKDLVYSNDFGVVYLKNLDGNHHYSTMKVLLPKATFTGLEDLNGDGHLDIIASDTIQNPNNPSGVIGRKIVWLKNDGNGNFLEVNWVISDEYYLMVYGDMDLDGDIDIIARSPYTSGNLYLFENLDGEGNFGDPQTLFSVSYYPVAIYLKDINGDIYPDLIYNINSPTDLVWHQNMGNNTFSNTPNIIMESEGFQDEFIALDFDLDGDIDVTYLNSDNNFVWYENDGLGNFDSEQLIVAEAYQPGVFTFYDIDVDGDLDLVYDVSGITQFILHYQDSSGSFGEAVPFVGYSNAYFFYFVDIEEDGDIDMFTNHIGLVFKENYTNSPVIRGEIFWDQNENGIKDLSEIGLYQQKVDLSPSSIVSFTSQDGKFLFPVHPGQYELNCQTSPGWGFGPNTSASYLLNVPALNDTIVQNIGLVVTDSTIQVAIDLTSGPTRCGFNVPFWLTYANQRAVFMDGIIHAAFDSLLFTDQVEFQYVNPVPDSIVGFHVYWSFEDLPPTQHGQIVFNIEIPGVDFLGDTFEIRSDIMVLDDLMEILFTDEHSYSSVINCAYDPNDKLVEPSFENFDNYTLFSDTLQYTIRFQNTGTDTAFTVKVEDLLDASLDWATFRVISASHLHETILEDNGKLTFTFNNILLPPQSQNETGSQGFVKFSIQPNANATDYATIYNTGQIFFDFNPPIITNRVTSILVTEYPILYDVLSPLCHDSEEGAITVFFPTPSFDFLWPDGSSANTWSDLEQGQYLLQIFNEWGGLVADSLIEVNAPDELSSIGIATTPAGAGSQDGTATTEAIGGTPPYTYSWGTPVPQSTNTAIGLAAGDYDLTISDANGCSVVQLFSIESVVSVTNSSQDGVFFHLFPNPSSGECLVEWQLFSDDWELNVFNTLGKKIQSFQSIEFSNAKAGLLMKNLAEGAYFVQLKMNGQALTRKLLVIK